LASRALPSCALASGGLPGCTLAGCTLASGGLARRLLRGALARCLTSRALACALPRTLAGTGLPRRLFGRTLATATLLRGSRGLFRHFVCCGHHLWSGGRRHGTLRGSGGCRGSAARTATSLHLRVSLGCRLPAGGF